MFFLKSGGGGQEIAVRYSLAFRSLVLVWLTLQACTLSSNPGRKKLGAFLLGAVVVLTAVHLVLIFMQ